MSINPNPAIISDHTVTVALYKKCKIDVYLRIAVDLLLFYYKWIEGQADYTKVKHLPLPTNATWQATYKDANLAYL